MRKNASLVDLFVERPLVEEEWLRFAGRAPTRRERDHLRILAHATPEQVRRVFEEARRRDVRSARGLVSICVRYWNESDH